MGRFAVTKVRQPASAGADSKEIPPHGTKRGRTPSAMAVQSVPVMCGAMRATVLDVAVGIGALEQEHGEEAKERLRVIVSMLIALGKRLANSEEPLP